MVWNLPPVRVRESVRAGGGTTGGDLLVRFGYHQRRRPGGAAGPVCRQALYLPRLRQSQRSKPG